MRTHQSRRQIARRQRSKKRRLVPIIPDAAAASPNKGLGRKKTLPRVAPLLSAGRVATAAR